jgi:hypothetical protein
LRLWLAHADSLKVQASRWSRGNHLTSLSVRTEQVDFDDLSSHHHGVKWTRIERDALGEAAKTANAFVASHVRSHADSLKVQISRGNYLSSLSQTYSHRT